MSETRTPPRVAPDIVWRLLDDSAVVVSPRGGDVRVLNKVGTAIWQLIIDRQDLPAITQYLESNYEVTRDRAHVDLLSLP